MQGEEPKVEFYMVNYVDYGDVNEYDDFNIKLKSFPIPINLKEKFLKTFKDDDKLSEKQILKFLKDNE